MKTTILMITLAILLTSCTTGSKVIEPANVQNSNVTISYNLGHSRYQFLATAKDEIAEISSWRDDKVLERKNISLEKYLKFADQVHLAIQSYKPETREEECRTPFQISLVSQKKQKTVNGCRGDAGDGQIGKVIKEGEHLFYTE